MAKATKSKVMARISDFAIGLSDDDANLQMHVKLTMQNGDEKKYLGGSSKDIIALLKATKNKRGGPQMHYYMKNKLVEVDLDASGKVTSIGINEHIGF